MTVIAMPPRPVPWRWQAGWLFASPLTRFAALFAAIQIPTVLLIAGLFLLLEPRMVNDERIRAQGVTTAGTVISVELDASTSVGNDRQHPLTIRYRYRADDGERTDEMQTMDRRVAEWPAGMEIPVRYDGDESQIDGITRFTFPWVVLLLVCGLQLPVAIVLLVPGMLTLRTRTRCHRDGMLCTAKLVSIEERSGMVFSRGLFAGSAKCNRGYRVTYVLRSSTGEAVIGRDVTRDVLLAGNRKPGDSIEVLALPGRERINCLPDPRLLVQSILDSVPDRPADMRGLF
ncbi:MAG TPA: DUF3592 domain-containing protein [bacterium]|nr:DUF3592 domain-containing protein [bacterium]